MISYVEKNLPVRMVRETLDDLPRHEPFGGCTIQPYQPGRAEDWLRIHELADQYSEIVPELFWNEFGRDEDLLAARQLYLIDPDGRAIGTASAWFDPDFQGAPAGRIHWVAIIPEFQGRGFAKPLLSAACDRLCELEHNRAYLMTSSARVPAITLYWRFGFRPDPRSPEEAEAWKELELLMRPSSEKI